MHSLSVTERRWGSHLLKGKLTRGRGEAGEDERASGAVWVLGQSLQSLKRYGPKGGVSIVPALYMLFSSYTQGSM